MLGWTIQPTLTSVNTSTSPTPGTILTISSFTVPQGIWIYEAIIYLPNYPTGFFEWYISNVVDGSSNESITGVSSSTDVTSRSTGIINNASSSTWYLTAKSSTASRGVLSVKLYLTRLA
jgi:hypothetical protein